MRHGRAMGKGDGSETKRLEDSKSMEVLDCVKRKLRENINMKYLRVATSLTGM